MNRNAVETIIKAAIDRACEHFERLGVHATDDAISFRAMADPTVRALATDPEAAMLLVHDHVKRIITAIPPQQDDESFDDYMDRCIAAVKAQAERGEPLSRLQQTA